MTTTDLRIKMLAEARVHAAMLRLAATPLGSHAETEARQSVSHAKYDLANVNAEIRANPVTGQPETK